MKKRINTLIYLLVSCFGFGQSAEELAKQRVDNGETPGIAVAIYENGKVTYFNYGVTSLKTKTPVNEKTVFEIGSITKVFTTSLLALYSSDTSFLYTPIQKLLPAGVKVPAKDDKEITLFNLATARSGLPRLPSNMMPVDPTNPYTDYTEKQLFEFLNTYQLTRGIGAEYEYSNLGMGLLGYLLELNVNKDSKQKKTYNDLIKEKITAPLGMTTTMLNYPNKSIPNQAMGHVGDVEVPAWTWTDQSVVAAAGGLLSSSEDMMKFMIAQMGTGKSGFDKAMKLAHQLRYDAGSPTMKIGLGWHIINDKIIWHNGGTGGFRSFAGFEPVKKKAVVILTNSTAGADDLGFYLLDPLSPLKPFRKSVELPESRLKEFVGIYELAPVFKITITIESGKLYAQATGQNKFQVFAESEMKFFYKVVNAQIEFTRDETGKVDKLLLHQGGIIQPAKKVE